MTILRSLPGVGRLVTATVLAEASGPWQSEIKDFLVHNVFPRWVE